MSFRPDLRRAVQDMPPPGGFPPIDITKTPRVRGPSGTQLFAGTSLLIAWGFYRVGQTNREKSALALEERKARFAIAPYLQAEEDKWYVEREKEIMKREQEIMKNVPGWKVNESPYITDRWVPRQVAPLDKNLKK